MEASRTRRYPFVSRGEPPPVAVARTEGPWLVTPDGRRIYDAAGGAIVANVGHGRAEVADAVREALASETYVVPPFATPSRMRLTERLQERWLPPGPHALPASRAAARRAWTRRSASRASTTSPPGGRRAGRCIGRELSYHGTTLGTLAVGGHTKRRAGFEPLLFDWPKAPACYPLRCALCRGAEGCNLACADAVEALILREGPDTVAAFVAEPVGGSTAGALVPATGYWPRVAEICRRHGVLLSPTR